MARNWQYFKTGCMVRGTLFFIISFTSLFSPGLADDAAQTNVAKFLPDDALLYISIRNLYDGYTQLRMLSKKLFGAEKGEEFFDSIEKKINEQLEFLDEPISKAIKNAIKDLKDLHLLCVDIEAKSSQEMPLLIAVLEAKETGLFDDIIESIKEYLEKPQEFNGIKIYEFRKEVAGYEYCIASLDKFGIFATNLSLVEEFISRFKGVKKDRSLENNPYYKILPEINDNKFCIQTFLDLKKFLNELLLEERRDRFGFDLIDSAFNISRLNAVTFDSRFDEDICKAKISVLFEKEMKSYDIIRQTAASKKIFELVPDDILLTAACTITDPVKFWEKLFEFMRKNELALEFGEGKAELAIKKAEGKLGVTFKEISETIGSEIGFFMDVPEFTRSQPTFTLIFELKDQEKGKKLIEKSFEIVSKVGRGWDMTTEEYEGVQINRARRKHRYFEYCIIDKYVVVSYAQEEVKRVITAYKNGKNLARNEGAKKISSTLPQLNSIIFISNYKKVYNLLMTQINRLGYEELFLLLLVPQLATEKPPDLIDNFLDQYDALATVDKDNELLISASGHNSVLALPLIISFMFVIPLTYRSHLPIEEPVEPPEKKIEPVTLPDNKEEADELIKSLIEDLQADYLDVRESATERLKAIGKPAVEALTLALSTEDPEVKARARNILIYLGEYELIPDFNIKGRIDTLLSKISNSIYVSSSGRGEDIHISRGIELDNEDKKIISTSTACKYLVSKLGDDATNINTKRAVAYLLYKTSKKDAASPIINAIKEIEKMIKEKREDIHSQEHSLRLLLVMALAKSDAKDAIDEILNSGDIWDFIAVCKGLEEARDTYFIEKLIQLLNDNDTKKRFHAGYTLEKVTGSGIKFNAFSDDSDRPNAIKEYQKWWQQNKTKFQIKTK